MIMTIMKFQMSKIKTEESISIQRIDQEKGSRPELIDKI